jgi:hypothetical protein
MVFETDYTSAGYNAYGEVAEIGDLIMFIETARGKTSGWSALSTEQKEMKIIDASFSLKSVDFAGTLNPAVITRNPMKFPRSGLIYDNGDTVPDNIVPEEIKMYVACFIYASMVVGYNDTISGAEPPIASKSVGDVNVSYDTKNATGSGGTREEFTGSCTHEHLPPDWIESVPETSFVVGTIPKTRVP